jgi:hypothetical protein
VEGCLSDLCSLHGQQRRGPHTPVSTATPTRQPHPTSHHGRCIRIKGNCTPLPTPLEFYINTIFGSPARRCPWLPRHFLAPCSITHMHRPHLARQEMTTSLRSYLHAPIDFVMVTKGGSCTPVSQRTPATLGNAASTLLLIDQSLNGEWSQTRNGNSFIKSRQIHGVGPSP